MNAWVLRAVGLGALTVGLRALLGIAMVYWPTNGTWLRPLALLALVAVVVAWGVLDGRADADGQRDLTMRWLKAGLAGGLCAGLVAWILDYVPNFDLGDNGLLFEISSGASFIILVIFIPGVLGVALGRYLARRKGKGGTAVDTPNLTKESASV